MCFSFEINPFKITPLECNTGLAYLSNGYLTIHHKHRETIESSVVTHKL